MHFLLVLEGWPVWMQLGVALSSRIVPMTVAARDSLLRLIAAGKFSSRVVAALLNGHKVVHAYN